MYTHHSMTYQTARYRQRDMQAAAERERRARQALRTGSPAEPPASHGTRRAWQLVLHLRPQAQS